MALGCSSDGIDLGGGALTQPLERGARCQDSTIVEGDVLVTNQQELEELEGCEEIRGDFTIRMFADAELTPLHALQVVEGGFLIGGTLFAASLDEERDSETTEETALTEQALSGTWLASLEGLESLELVGALMLSNTAVTDLSPLAQLRGDHRQSVARRERLRPRPHVRADRVGQRAERDALAHRPLEPGCATACARTSRGR